MLRLPANSWRNALFVRLIITNLVVILPIILLGVYLYNWSYTNASNEISKNTTAQLSYYLEDLNHEIEWLEIQQYDILQDNDLNKLAVTWSLMDNADKKAGIDYLLHRFTSIKNSSVYIKDISVHIRTIQKSISSSNGVDEFDRLSFDFLHDEVDKKEGRLIRYNDALNLSAAKYGGKEGEPIYIVQIELDMDKLRESLQQISVYPESGSFLISNRTGYTLASNASTSGALKSYVFAAIRTKENTLVTRIDNKNYHLDKAYSEPLGLTVVTYLPESVVKKPLNGFNNWAWVFALTSCCAIVIYAFSTYKFVHKPLLLLVQSFRKMEGGALDIHIDHEKKDEFGYLYNRFNQMISKLQTLIDQDFKQTMMMQKAELKQLQSQIKPHFLYNSFFILNSLAKTGDLERVELFTNMLGEYYRFITRNGEDNVLLAEETRHSRMYTEIQKLRFSRRIKVEFDELPKDMERIRVPRLIIQPIIENAYEHSLEKMTNEGFLRVSFDMDREEARVIVENNGDFPLDDEQLEKLQARLDSKGESGEMTGMINIHRRIMLTYGEGSGLHLSRSELNGMRVEIRIKLEGAGGLV
ncbi:MULTISPECIES: histidine kinase [unclassified Paenibacillus]|uniref:sensor histidine kinase n=1 Tax=unclassified Paenibacillus TaxID=185978 RepID=UPI0010451270|nr:MULTISPECIES: histidine kinase [unclassified Paenibacillus]NIK68082.1 two-component system sensor histidine kinase YesM [Paenibacillus sp. BK720]TCM99699.1 two-component system sensor histidine kinase YesM [Paenibacillus sp. BK033]